MNRIFSLWCRINNCLFNSEFCKLPVLSIFGEPIVQGLRGEFEWLGTMGPILLLSRRQGNSPHPVQRNRLSQNSMCTFSNATNQPLLTLQHCITATRYIRVLQQCSAGHDDPATWIYVERKRETEGGKCFASPWMTPALGKASLLSLTTFGT